MLPMVTGQYSILVQDTLNRSSQGTVKVTLNTRKHDKKSAWWKHAHKYLFVRPVEQSTATDFAEQVSLSLLRQWLVQEKLIVFLMARPSNKAINTPHKPFSVMELLCDRPVFLGITPRQTGDKHLFSAASQAWNNWTLRWVQKDVVNGTDTEHSNTSCSARLEMHGRARKRQPEWENRWAGVRGEQGNRSFHLHKTRLHWALLAHFS